MTMWSVAFVIITSSRPVSSKDRRWSAALVAMAGIFFFLAGAAAFLDSPTYDEARHLKYGARILNGDSDQYKTVYSPFASCVPFSGLNAIPKKLFSTPAPLDMLEGRFVTILFSVLVSSFIYRWSKELYGSWAARLSFFLYLFDPNILAHSHLVTTDIYALGMMLISLYFIWKFSKEPTPSRAFQAALAVAVSQLAKYACLFLYPLILILGAMRWRRWREWARLFLLSVLLSFLAINSAHFFNKTFLPLERYEFRSSLFRRVQAAAPHMISPLPGPYLNGLDTQRNNLETGEGISNLYLFGKLRETNPGFEGFKGYFLAVSFFKTPIAVQLFMLWAFAAYRGRKERDFFANESFLLVPALFFTVFFNWFFNMQVGLRYFLVVFPFIYVFCGSVLAGPAAFSKPRKYFAAVLAAFFLWSNLSYFPHYISYCNEWVWDKLRAYRLFADSNLDWGQDWMRMKSYLAAHPEAVFSPQKPMTGKIVVRLNELVGVYDAERFRWLRENFSPSGRIAHSFLVFDVPEADLRRLNPASHNTP